MEKIKDHDPETIEKIWLEYHSTKNCLSAVIPAETYRTLFKRGQQYPTVIFIFYSNNFYELMII